MKILLPVEDKDSKIISDNFGRSEYFLLIDGDNYLYIYNENLNLSNGAGVKAAQLVIDLEVDVVIVPKLGEKASKLLKLADIDIYKSTSKSLNENLELLKENKLKYL